MKKSDQLYEHFIKALRENQYYPGQKISESAVCREWNVSRGTVRETFARLAAEGFMEIRPKSGSYIRQKKPIDYVETLEVRAALERTALRNIISKKTIADVTALKKNHDLMNKTAESEPFDVHIFQTAHQNFHKELITLTKNHRLMQVFDQLPLEETGLFQPIVSPSVIEETLSEHQNIIRIILDRDKTGPDWLEQLICSKIDFLT